MLKKKVICLLMSILCILGTVLCIQVPVNAHPSRVVDDADLLADYEEEEILSLVNEISERQQFDVVILTVDSLDGEDIQDFSADYYDYNGYGIGDDYDGVMFTISMQEREWYMLTTGSVIDILTDSDLDAMAEEIVPYLSDGDYAHAFMRFAQACDEAASNISEDETGIILSIVIGLVLAFVPVLIMRGQLKSVKMQVSAGNYEKPESRKITVQRDTFLYHTVNRVPRPKETQNRSGGGSTTFRGSSGRSHGGRGGGF